MDSLFLTATTNANQLAWSPTGEWIAYDLGALNAIRLIRPDRTGDHVLVTHGFDPTFSPDGQRLAFSRYTGDEIAIWSVDLSGQNLRQLTWPRGSGS